MNPIELIQFSLNLAFEHLENLVADLTQEQADWLPPGKANSVGSLYWHTIAYVDQITHEWCMEPIIDITVEEWFKNKRVNPEWHIGKEALRLSAGWQEKVVLALPPENPGDPYWEIRNTREGLRMDLSALHDYAGAVTQIVQSWVASLALEDLERSIPTPFGDYNLGPFLEYFVIWHINTHVGEIAAIKGCQGLEGYPW
jgi:hypothetical protein